MAAEIKNILGKNALRKLLEGLDRQDLITLRAMINGKISRRKITPEQQEKMQRARKKQPIPISRLSRDRPSFPFEGEV